MTAVRYPQRGVTAEAYSHSLKPVMASLGSAFAPPLQMNRDAVSGDTTCSGTVFCVAKRRLRGRSAAGRASQLKPYLPRSCKLHKAMGTWLARSFLSPTWAFCAYLLRYKGIIPYKTNVCQAK